MKKEIYLITLKAEERAGLLHLITGMIEKPQIEIKSLILAPSNIHGIVAINIELHVKSQSISTLALKLENIIEVLSVQVAQHEQVIAIRAAYFRLAKGFLADTAFTELHKHRAMIVNWSADEFIVAHHGNDQSVRLLYNLVDGPFLLGFSQTGLISEQSINDFDAQDRVENTIERITRLAA